MAGCNAWMPLHRRSLDHTYLRSHRNCWTCWTKAHQVMVPTTDTVRSAFLLQTLVLALVYISLFWSLQIVCRWKRSLNAFSSGYMLFLGQGIQWVPCPLLWIDRHWKNGPPVWVSEALICSRLPWSPARLSFSKSCWNASCLDTSGRFKSYRSGGSRIILRARSLLMTFIIFDKSSCIIFAVVRSTLLLWHFLLHSLFFS